MTLLALISYIFTLACMSIGLIVLAFTIPAVTREGNVKNGLRNYRRIFLIAGYALLILGVATTAILTTRFLIPLETYRTFSAVVLMLFGGSFLINVIMLHKIYTYKFTPENKSMHEMIEALEQGRARIVMLKKEAVIEKKRTDKL